MIAPASLKPLPPAAAGGGTPTPLRGMIAPASLKRRAGCERRIHHEYATPGHDCPGLIEARRIDAKSYRSTVHPLRGMIAPASLKPVSMQVTFNQILEPLRGMIAPASLKPGRSETLARPA